MEKIKKIPRELIVPNTLKNRKGGWMEDDPNITYKTLPENQFELMDDNFVFEDINDAVDLCIAAYEEEEIPYEKLDVAIAVVEKRKKEEFNPELVEGLSTLLEMLKLAKEKKTLLALYL